MNKREFDPDKYKASLLNKKYTKNFDDIPLPEEVQRDISSSLPKKKSFPVFFLIAILVFVFLGLGVYAYFSPSDNIVKQIFLREDVCSKVDISVAVLSDKTCYDSNQSLFKVYVQRGSNSFSLKSVNFQINSNSDSISHKSEYYLPKNSKNIYYINYSGLSNIENVEIYFVLETTAGLKNCSKTVINKVYPCDSPIIMERAYEDGSGYIYVEENESDEQTPTEIEVYFENQSEVPLNDSAVNITANVTYQNTTNVINVTNTTGNNSSYVPPTQPTTRLPVETITQAISNCEQLQNIKNKLNGNYYLASNVDCLASKDWNEGLGFEPIGKDMQDIFYGKLDGKGYSVSNLYINRPDENNVGLFGYSEGTISNLGLLNVNITGDWYTASLVGEQYSGNIYKVYSTGRVSGGNLVGGLIGGLDSYSDSNAVVSRSYSSAIVSGEANVGGFVGVAMDGVITNCYAAGSVSADNTVGGFVGSANGIISNSYSSGLVLGDTFIDMDVGGFAGFVSGISEISNSYFDKQTSGQDISVDDGDTPQGEPKTTSQMKTQSTFSGWDFTNVWKMEGYPRLK